MSSDIAIRVSTLGKRYEIYETPRDRLLQMLMRGRKQYFREFWALRDVSFEIKRGETVGIIGRNGSGKSTLLQLICGTLNPTVGSIEARGRVAALLELGAGFNPEFTGRENVYLAASLYGLTHEAITSRFDQISRFADIGDFIDQPVKTYSSGMFVRLAFAVIAHVDADILVIDEALSVGDAFFVQKCMRFLRSFMKQGTLLFCSHDTGAVVNLCNKAILLNQGKVDLIGAPKDVTDRYLAKLYECDQEIDGRGKLCVDDEVADDGWAQDDYKDARHDLINASTLRNDIEIFRFDPEQAGFGTGGAAIVSVRILDRTGAPLARLIGGMDVILEIRCKAREEISRPIVGFQFKDRLGQVIFADNTYITYQYAPPHIEASAELRARFEFRMPILPSGDYSISVALADGSQESHVQLHWLYDALIVTVHTSSICFGLVGIPMRRITLEGV